MLGDVMYVWYACIICKYVMYVCALGDVCMLCKYDLLCMCVMNVCVYGMCVCVCDVCM